MEQWTHTDCSVALETHPVEARNAGVLGVWTLGSPFKLCSSTKPSPTQFSVDAETQRTQSTAQLKRHTFHVVYFASPNNIRLRLRGCRNPQFATIREEGLSVR